MIIFFIIFVSFCFNEYYTFISKHIELKSWYTLKFNVKD